MRSAGLVLVVPHTYGLGSTLACHIRKGRGSRITVITLASRDVTTNDGSIVLGTRGSDNSEKSISSL